MIKVMRKAILPALLVVLTSGGMSAQAQYRRAPVSEYSQQMVRVVDRIDLDAKRLQENVDRFLDRGRLDGTNREDEINEKFKRLRDAANRLKDRVDDERAPDGEVRDLYSSWKDVESFIQRNPNVARNVQRDLEVMNTNLNQLRDVIANRTNRTNRIRR